MKKSLFLMITLVALSAASPVSAKPRPETTLSDGPATQPPCPASICGNDPAVQQTF